MPSAIQPTLNVQDAERALQLVNTLLDLLPAVQKINSGAKPKKGEDDWATCVKKLADTVPMLRALVPVPVAVESIAAAGHNGNLIGLNSKPEWKIYFTHRNETATSELNALRKQLTRNLKAKTVSKKRWARYSAYRSALLNAIDGRGDCLDSDVYREVYEEELETETQRRTLKKLVNDTNAALNERGSKSHIDYPPYQNLITFLERDE